MDKAVIVMVEVKRVNDRTVDVKRVNSRCIGGWLGPVFLGVVVGTPYRPHEPTIAATDDQLVPEAPR